MALTDLAISKAKPTDKTQKLFDGRGLFLEITPKGSKRWRHKYYFQGKEKLLSLGLYPDVSLAEAREILSDQKKLLAKGIDPSAVRQAIETARIATTLNQFEVVAREWYGNKQSSWSESHAKVTMQRLERDVFPLLGSRGIAEITAPEVLSLLQAIVKRGSVETAHRVKSIISQVLRYGIATDRVNGDVTAGLKGALPPSPERHLAAITDPKELGHALKLFDGYSGGVIVSCALRLTPLVFVRPGELRMMEWSQIDWETQEWQFTLSKTNQPHIVPLANQAIVILQEIHPFTARGKYVFPSPRTSQRPMSNAAITAALRSLGLTGDKVTGHGFRATARTMLDEILKYRPDLIEHQLGHTVKDPLGRAYNRTTHLDERRKMMQAWANYLDKLKEQV